MANPQPVTFILEFCVFIFSNFHLSYLNPFINLSPPSTSSPCPSLHQPYSSPHLYFLLYDTLVVGRQKAKPINPQRGNAPSRSLRPNPQAENRETDPSIPFLKPPPIPQPSTPLQPPFPPPPPQARPWINHIDNPSPFPRMHSCIHKPHLP